MSEMDKRHYFHPCILTTHESFKGFSNNICQNCHKEIVDLTQVKEENLQDSIEELKAGTCVKIKREQLALSNKLRKSIQILAISSLLLGGCKTNKTVVHTSAKSISTDTADNDQSKKDTFIGVVVEQMPKLIGGLKGLEAKLRYPTKAIDNDIEGKVYVQFTIDTTGSTKDIRVVRSLSPSCDKEAVRLVKTAKFIPAHQRGKPVSVMYSLPVIFKLPKE